MLFEVTLKLVAATILVTDNTPVLVVVTKLLVTSTMLFAVTAVVEIVAVPDVRVPVPRATAISG